MKTTLSENGSQHSFMIVIQWVTTIRDDKVAPNSFSIPSPRCYLYNERVKVAYPLHTCFFPPPSPVTGMASWLPYSNSHARINDYNLEFESHFTLTLTFLPHFCFSSMPYHYPLGHSVDSWRNLTYATKSSSFFKRIVS